MSETKLSTNEIKNWLEKETGSTLAPVQAQAQRHRDDMQAALQSLSDASKMLLDNSQKEIEKRNMRVYNRARALNKLAHLFIERIKKLNVPETISYDSLYIFIQDTQKALSVTEIDLKNWFPRISPFFIMDRRKFLAYYERTKMTFNAFNDFVSKEYVKTKVLEKTFILITELQSIEEQLSTIETQKEDLKNERLQIENEIATSKQQNAELKGSATLEQLSLVEAEIDVLNNDLKYTLRHLQKPFLKMQALAISGGGAGLTPDEVKQLGQYMENPFEAMLTEVTDSQMLKEILQKLARLMSEDKLKLKQDKARKAEQAVDDILNRDSLANFHEKCVNANTRKKQLLNSQEMENAKQSLALLEEQIEKLQFRRENLEEDEKLKENIQKELQEKIHNHKRTIEANTLSFLGRPIQIQ